MISLVVFCKNTNEFGLLQIHFAIFPEFLKFYFSISPEFLKFYFVILTLTKKG
jgi:hypothetical protein